VLQQPDFTKTLTDALVYGVGAVLLQEGGTLNLPNLKPKWHLITYYNTFTPTEQNYNIYKKREFLGVVKALDYWQLYLI